MLDSDELPSAERISSMYADTGAPQFWDGQQLLGKEVTRSLGLDPDHVAWDIYLFYPPDAEWTDAGLPPPAKAIAQSRGLVIGAKGTLPPKGDQSMVPPWYEGRADVVGRPRELGDLLTAIAVPFIGAPTAP